MKKKIIFIVIFIILCFGFIAGVQIIKYKRSGYEKETKSESIMTGKTFSFEDVLKETKISEICEIEITVPSKKQERTMLNYFFTAEDKMQEIQKFVSEYEYMESSVKLDGSHTILWTAKYKQSNDRILNMMATQSERTDLVEIIFLLENIGGVQIEFESGWVADYGLKGFFVDSKVSDKILKMISDSEKISKEYIVHSLQNTSGLPSMTDFFCFNHEWQNSYKNNNTEESYDVYMFELSDIEGYVLLYCVDYCIARISQNQRWRNVFRIELYNNAGELTEILYDNQEGYKKLMEDIRGR